MAGLFGPRDRVAAAFGYTLAPVSEPAAGAGSRHSQGRRGQSRPPLRLERPPRDLRPLLLRGEVAPAS